MKLASFFVICFLFYCLFVGPDRVQFKSVQFIYFPILHNWFTVTKKKTFYNINVLHISKGMVV